MDVPHILLKVVSARQIFLPKVLEDVKLEMMPFCTPFWTVKKIILMFETLNDSYVDV
jgi:hypothetical protein